MEVWTAGEAYATAGQLFQGEHLPPAVETYAGSHVARAEGDPLFPSNKVRYAVSHKPSGWLP